MRKTLLALALGLTTSTAFAAGEHGGSHEKVSGADIDRTIRFEAGDMWFNPGSLDIAPGETIKFEIVNTGNLEHEFVIGDAEAQESHREMMQEMGGSHGNGGHGSHGGHGMAEGEHGGSMPSVTIAPGETAELVWTAPRNVDVLEYACNIPGHYESGMFGNIDFQG
ncbi:copper-binding protein [Halomonas sp. KAO]|uniref:cupredoxin domain-containing protein n=1 Tax=unclassified Halomonas TaxID=2609666 RepID=UPI00189C62E2|nr:MULTISPECIES: plastocyanin/azurin family copper-binding protein [unclassified Halomonas]MBF7051911.1 copper-binding protein [Halomonas sp. KAO]MDT0501353.1 plastocyanin/azurin family copper-binding protein [Halomonas sp. PAR7]MDT0512123.1 plastocyanin/azurin family copper-binding protein [Halomonas sp. LES1]MDT0590740.1 plastocyanin/azurin family copper-binding protein [Halomonas sp. PAR8]